MSDSLAVLMPCYNNGDYVAVAIESVLAQTHAPDEIIIVDDGSTDHSADLISSFGDAVRCFPQPNGGRAAAMNRALAETHCELVAIIDADDLWRPQLLEKNVAALIDNHAVMAYCLGTLCDQQGIALNRQYGKPMHAEVMRHMLTDNHVFGGGPVLRKQTVLDAGGYDATFWPCDDYHLWLRMAARGKIAFQPEPLAMYRMHTGQVSNQTARMARQKLAAKLDFLTNHPQFEKDFGRSFIRQVTEGEYYKTCTAQFQQGQLHVAREMFKDYVRRYPHRIRGWWQFGKAQLPWRMIKHFLTPPPPTSESAVPSV